MPAPRISVFKVRRLAKLHVVGQPPSIRSMAKILHISRSTIQKYQLYIRNSGYSFKDFAVLGPTQMHFVLSQSVKGSAPKERYLKLLGIFPEVYANLSEGHMNIKHSWNQYRELHPDGCKYTQFAAHFLAWRKSQGLPPPTSRKWSVFHIAKEDMPELMRWRRSSDRVKWAKAVIIIDSHKGIGPTSLSSKVEKSPSRVLKK
jgi:hypothetical protein